MKKDLLFIDLELNTKNLLAIAGLLIKSENSIPFIKRDLRDNLSRVKAKRDFEEFILRTEFIAGHNIINHDLKYLKEKQYSNIPMKVIDTLYFS